MKPNGLAYTWFEKDFRRISSGKAMVLTLLAAHGSKPAAGAAPHYLLDSEIEVDVSMDRMYDLENPSPSLGSIHLMI